MNNPRSLRYQAACIRHMLSKEDDPLRREALEHAADNLEKVAQAVPPMKAVLGIYGVWPDAELVVHNNEPDETDVALHEVFKGAFAERYSK